MNRHLSLTLVLAAALTGCDAPPEPPAEKTEIPCLGGTADAIVDAAFTCGPDRTVQLVVTQEWLCADGQRRPVTRVRRSGIPCEPDLARDGLGADAVRSGHAAHPDRNSSPYPVDTAGGILR